MKPTTLSYLMILSLFLLSSCSKLFDDGCYSRKVERNHSGGCFAVYEPVCGCDGTNYSSPCRAAAAGITSYTEGKCD